MSKSQSSGVLSASTLVATGRNFVAGVIVGADGTNAATVNIYDGTSTSGTKILTLVVKAGDRQVVLLPARSVRVDAGIYAEVSGTGAAATVLFGA